MKENKKANCYLKQLARKHLSDECMPLLLVPSLNVLNDFGVIANVTLFE